MWEKKQQTERKEEREKEKIKRYEFFAKLLLAETELYEIKLTERKLSNERAQAKTGKQKIS